jgi:Fur family ferric uptake transcriptional regulator
MATLLAERLRSAGYKLTPPRLAVLTVLEESDEHLSHADLLAQGRTIYPTLGRATVYRTLEILTDLSIVRPIYLGDQSVSYTRVDQGHHHLICTECGAVTEFDDCVIGELQSMLARRHEFSIRGHLLEFYGLCSRCTG